MKNIIYFGLLIFVSFIIFFPSPSQAFYKKKVMVGKFQNPAGWDKPYHPGNIISEVFSQDLMQRENLQLIPISTKMKKIMDDDNLSIDENYVEPAIYNLNKKDNPELLFIQNTDNQIKKQPKFIDSKLKIDDPLWPAKLGNKTPKSSFTKIRGKVIKFIPDNRISNSSISSQSKHIENAVIEVHVQLVQNNTGRVLYEKLFRKTSRLGTQPFSIDKIILTDINKSADLSSMNTALNSLKHEVGDFISDKIVYLPLEGEIIATTRKLNKEKKSQNSLITEEILVNIGLSNGVRIGDLFHVNALGVELDDPYTAADLGDIYVKVGVIQITQAWEGTAMAMPLIGKDFEKGFLIRSVVKEIRKEEENIPWWEFSIKAVN